MNWPAASGGWRSRSSGRRRSTAWTTWWASSRAATSAGSCRWNWRSWRCPSSELDTLRRLVERQTLCREYQSVEPVARGPIIVAIDERGSMSGEKVNTAKAIALALAWVARQQRRWVALVAYSGDSGERILALPPGRWDEAAAHGLAGRVHRPGSEIDIPVREMPRMYRDLKAPEGKTDVLFITDAICKIPRAGSRIGSTPGSER